LFIHTNETKSPFEGGKIRITTRKTERAKPHGGEKEKQGGIIKTTR